MADTAGGAAPGGAKPAGGAVARPGRGTLTQRKRPARTATSGSGSSGRALQRSQPGILRLYADEAPGIKIGPTFVLVMSLMFIGFVVLLHIYGKITSPPS